MDKLVKQIVKEKKKCYFISPHLDDAAFSAGGLISYLSDKTEVVAITVFTEAGEDKHSLSAISYAKQCGYSEEKFPEFFEARRREDKELFESYGIKVKHLGFLDALWRPKQELNFKEKLASFFLNDFRYIYPTHKWHISKGKIHDADMVNLVELQKKLTEIVGDGGDAQVFCPVGVGEHVDHVMTREACKRAFENVIYWEDSPYNLYHDTENEFVVREDLTGVVFEKGQDRRKSMYPAYKTQFGKLFDGEKEFRLPPERFYLMNERNGGVGKKDVYKSLPQEDLAGLIGKHFNKKKLKGMIFGNFGSKNLGDEVILAAELEDLNKLKAIEVCVVGQDPKEIQDLHKVESLSYYSFRGIIRKIWKSDFVIVGGGGIFCKNWAAFRGFLFQIYFLIFFIVLPGLLKKKIFVVGVGFYENMSPVAKQLSLFLLNFVDYISVRDFHSYDLLKENGKKTKLKKDLAFNLALDNKKPKKDTNTFNIGLSITSMNSPELNDTLTDNIAKIISKSPANFRFFLFPLDINSRYSLDLKMAKEVCNDLPAEKKQFCTIVRQQEHPKHFFARFQDMDFFLAMRLHSMIFCYRMGIDFEGVGYDLKCLSFLHSIGKKNRSPESLTKLYPFNTCT